MSLRRTAKRLQDEAPKLSLQHVTFEELASNFYSFEAAAPGACGSCRPWRSRSSWPWLPRSVR
jgi:hypothetical protein